MRILPIIWKRTRTYLPGYQLLRIGHKTAHILLYIVPTHFTRICPTLDPFAMHDDSAQNACLTQILRNVCEPRRPSDAGRRDTEPPPPDLTQRREPRVLRTKHAWLRFTYILPLSSPAVILGCCRRRRRRRRRRCCIRWVCFLSTFAISKPRGVKGQWVTLERTWT